MERREVRWKEGIGEMREEERKGKNKRGKDWRGEERKEK